MACSFQGDIDSELPIRPALWRFYCSCSWEAAVRAAECCARNRRSGDSGALLIPADQIDFSEKFVKRGEVEITLEQRGHRTESLVGSIQQAPDGIGHGGTVGIDDQVFGLVMVAGNVDVGDAFGWQTVEESVCVIAVIDAVDVNIVDVEEEFAVGALDHGLDEIQLAHIRTGIGVVGNVFHSGLAFKQVLDSTDAIGDPGHGLLKKGQGHQLIQMAMFGAVAQVIGIQGDTVFIEKAPQPLNIALIQRCWRAKRQRQPVNKQGIALAAGPELAAQFAADADPVLRCDFKKVRLSALDILKRTQKGPPQAQASSLNRELPGIHRERQRQAAPQDPSPQEPSPQEPSASSSSSPSPSPQEPSPQDPSPQRSEERRVGKECVS